ncbi:MAG: transposase [Limisphaerales bacterium]
MSEVMGHRLKPQAVRAHYKLRQQTVEPVFGILKSAMGFRQFLLRVTAEVSLEWELLCLECNLRRLHALGNGLKLAAAR